MIFWSIFNIEELERIKMEEAVKVGVLRFEMLLIHFSLNIDELLIFIMDWSTILPMSSFFLGLFTDFRIPDTVETPSNIRLGF